MGLTVTFNGTLGRSTASFSREVLRGLALASMECAVETGIMRFLLRKDAAPIDDTELPIAVPFGQVGVAKFVYIHVTNAAVIRVDNSAGATDHQSCDYTLGGPEGSLILFAASVTGISIISTTTDMTEIEVYVAGDAA
jgi:hypothetical protein